MDRDGLKKRKKEGKQQWKRQETENQNGASLGRQNCWTKSRSQHFSWLANTRRGICLALYIWERKKAFFLTLLSNTHQTFGGGVASRRPVPLHHGQVPGPLTGHSFHMGKSGEVMFSLSFKEFLHTKPQKKKILNSRWIRRLQVRNILII